MNEMANVELEPYSGYRELPTQQRRLRHLRSIAARNLTVKSGDDLSCLEAYFSLHLDATSPALYKSERIRGSLNPTWRCFNLNHVVSDSDSITSAAFVVRVWYCHGAAEKLCIQWIVDMFGLIYIGDKLKHTGTNYTSDTLLFGIFDGFYATPDTDTPLDFTNVTRCRLKVEQALVKESYSTNSLSRIQTILRAIKQTKSSVCKVRKSIEEKLSQSQSHSEKKQEREVCKLRISLLRKDLEQRMAILQSRKEHLEMLQVTIHTKDVSLRSRFETLEKDKNRLRDKKTGYFDVREDLIKTGAQLVMRRKQLISELALIYPITEVEGTFKVCDIVLPNSEDFTNKEETMIAGALGYTCHLVMMISEYLDVPVRYPMEHKCSKSRIRDHILDKLTDKDRDFPLYSKGKEKFQFHYGVYLLNKNIAQLRYYCGLGTTDLRLTLPNLKSLLELRLGVAYEMTNTKNVMTSLPGQHIPVPPNLGGPQKLTSGLPTMVRSRGSSPNPETVSQENLHIIQSVIKAESVPSKNFEDRKQEEPEKAMEYIKHNNNYSVNQTPADKISNSENDDTLVCQQFPVYERPGSNDVTVIQLPEIQPPAPTLSHKHSSGSLNSCSTQESTSARMQNHLTLSSPEDTQSIEIGSEAVETPCDSLQGIDRDLLTVFNSEDSLSNKSENNSNFDEPDMVLRSSASRESNASSSSGPSFKMWAQNRKRSNHTGFESDNDSERDIDHTPHSLNLDLGDLYKSRSVDDLDSPDSDSEFPPKHSAMSNSMSHNQILGNVGMGYQEKYDIQQRTDALSSGFSFKLKSNRPANTVKNHKHKGVLDDCLDDSSS